MKKYGLLGYPLGHSFSRDFFNRKFQDEKINAEYVNFEIPDIRFAKEVILENPELCGLNVTIHLKGFNSDVIGFVQSIQPLLEPHHQKALILGCTGGASKAVRYGLETKLNLEVKGVSRRPSESSITYAEITPELLEEYTVIVNCTPSGMYPHVNECPELPYEALTSRHLLYDLIYNPEETLFLQKGAQYGAKTKNGMEMLLLQAMASWDIWNRNNSL